MEKEVRMAAPKNLSAGTDHQPTALGCAETVFT